MPPLPAKFGSRSHVNWPVTLVPDGTNFVSHCVWNESVNAAGSTSIRTNASMFPCWGAVPSTSSPCPFWSTERSWNSPLFGLKESVELVSSAALNDVGPRVFPSTVPPSTWTVAWPVWNRTVLVGYATPEVDGNGIIVAAAPDGRATCWSPPAEDGAESLLLLQAASDATQTVASSVDRYRNMRKLLRTAGSCRCCSPISSIHANRGPAHGVQPRRRMCVQDRPGHPPRGPRDARTRGRSARGAPRLQRHRRRRGGLLRRRRPRADRDHRLLHADRRRPGRLGTDRCGERPLRRVRDGWKAGARAEPRRMAGRRPPRGDAGGGAPRWPGRRDEGRRGRRRRPLHQRSGAEVRHGRDRIRRGGEGPAELHGPGGRHAVPHEADRDRDDLHRDQAP